MDSDEDFDLDDLDLDLDDLDLDVEEESEPAIYFSQEMSEEDRKWLDPVLKFLELDTADDDQLAEISQNIPRVYLLYKNALARTTFQYADKKRHLKRAEAEVRLKFLDSSSSAATGEDGKPRKKPTLPELDSRVITDRTVIRAAKDLAETQLLLDKLASVVEALKMRSDALPALLGYRNKRTSIGEIR